MINWYYIIILISRFRYCLSDVHCINNNYIYVTNNRIELDKFYLQLPVTNDEKNSVLTIKNDLSNFKFIPFFFVDKNVIHLSVDVKEAEIFGKRSTKNSKYLRTELREITNGWSLRDTRPHILSMKISIDTLDNVDNGVIIAQIHGKDSKPNISLRLNKGKLFIHNHKNSQNTPNNRIGFILDNYKLGTVFKLEIIAGNSEVQFFIDNVKHNIVISSNFDNQYFKTGAYCQDNRHENAICAVSIYELKINE